MTAKEAEAVLALLCHLDGSQLAEPSDLVDDVHLLADAAGVALGGALPLDMDVIADVLDEAAERWDAEYDAADEDEDADEYLPIDDDPDWRAVETAPVGDVL